MLAWSSSATQEGAQRPLDTPLGFERVPIQKLAHFLQVTIRYVENGVGQQIIVDCAACPRDDCAAEFHATASSRLRAFIR